MKLSIVIPAYNEERLIGTCLESALRAMEGKPYDVEIVVVNNASTDRTREIAVSFPGVRVVDEPKRGALHARRAGHRVALGDLVAHVDADTLVPDEWIDRVFREFRANEDLVALSGPYIYYDLSPWHRAAVKVFYSVGYVTHLFNHYVIRKGAMLQGGNYVVRRSAFEAIGGYSDDFDFYGDDTDIARRIQKVGRVKFTFRLPMYTSGRRLRTEGAIAAGATYAINYVWATVFKKPFTKSHRDIRS